MGQRLLEQLFLVLAAGAGGNLDIARGDRLLELRGIVGQRRSDRLSVPMVWATAIFSAILGSLPR
jgi:hypothetical protein